MISYTAFHAEIEKIAQDQEGGPAHLQEPEPKKPFITKATLKRLAIVLPVAAAGAGAGAGVNQLIRKAVLRRKGGENALAKWVKKRPIGQSIGRKLPAIAGGVAAAAGTLLALKNKKVKEYLEGKNEGKRPK